MSSEASGAPTTASTGASLTRALSAVAPALNLNDLSAWTSLLSAKFAAAQITTPRRIAAFLGQTAAESGGFRRLEEDLGYSAPRLCQVWPSRFPTLASAQPFAFRPEALANQVYANRMGNGDAASGDGWRFRGRGLIQLTGRAAYERFAASCGLGLDDVINAAATADGAARTAIWFWESNGLNGLADAWALDRITMRINGGMQGAAERVTLCDAALRMLGA